MGCIEEMNSTLAIRNTFRPTGQEIADSVKPISKNLCYEIADGGGDGWQLLLQSRSAGEAILLHDRTPLGMRPPLRNGVSDCILNSNAPTAKTKDGDDLIDDLVVSSCEFRKF
jgi:hypothetical protein